MKYNVYSIRDNLTGFLTPTFDVNDASAVRNFQHAMRNPQSLLNSHAQDYDLYRIGVFDQDTGSIESIVPVMVCAGASCKEV